MNNKNVGRREFLGDCGKMSGVGAMASLINLTMTNNLVAANGSTPSDYKAIVCLYMDGGNDSFNMLRPGVDGYQDYLDFRRQIAIGRRDEDRIVDRDGDDYHLHSGMSGVRNMFNNGDLSFVANVGTAVEPITAATFNQRRRPRAIGSHFDQTRQWQNSVPNLRGGSIAGQGWIGRMTDVLNGIHDLNPTANINMNISPTGNNLSQTSIKQRPLVLRGGANPLNLYQNRQDVRRVLDHETREAQYANILQNHYRQTFRTSIEANNELAGLEDSIQLNTNFPNTALGRDFEQVAKYIAAQRQTGHNRQTFFIRDGGHDAHRGVIGQLNSAMPRVSQALTAFNAAMREIGYHDQVVTYTASDFGRNLRSNGSGSGHGWGSNQMVMGGPIQGGRMLGGRYPELAVGGEYILNSAGRVVPQLSIDQLHASLAYWFGVENNAQMETMLPNIRNFWARESQLPANRRGLPPMINMFTQQALQNRAI